MIVFDRERDQYAFHDGRSTGLPNQVDSEYNAHVRCYYLVDPLAN